ncbi:MAG TPA: sodium:proton antiporter [Sphingomicrobium sp.]|nr:sodium:proton antiporter [Sphingomicrobium sp.]
MTGESLTSMGLLLLVACLIAIVSRKFGMPYIVGLVIAGILIALLPITPELPLSRELIFDIFLPPLIFEGALQLDWKSFRRELPLTLTLALLGVAIGAVFVAASMHLVFGWSLIGAALFGTLIAATDPVSVIAAFREMGAEKRLAMVVESESLLNDAVVAVAFVVLIGIAAGGSASPATVLPQFLLTALIGIAVGAAASGLAMIIAYNTSDSLIEIAITTVAAYGSFLVAEHFHGSGVLAAMTAGMMFGNIGWHRVLSASGCDDLDNAWAYFAFLANSFVFLLIGMNTASQPLLARDFLPFALVIVLVLIGRALAIYPLAALFRPTRLALSGDYQHVLFWGGLRGALALALALGVPSTVPEANLILAGAFAVVAFSILVQGLTMPPLIRRLGVGGKRADPDPCADSASGRSAIS